MDAIPSAHLRQQKLDHQRQLIEQKQKQKRQSVGTLKYNVIVMNILSGIIILIFLVTSQFKFFTKLNIYEF